MRAPKIPKPTVRRLAIYYRCLNKLKENGIEKTSSKEMADLLGIKASQVRKDLSYFGEFGKRGVGYNVDKLSFKLKEILGLKKNWNVAIVGAGNLGYAIANYSGLEKNGFKVVTAFDNDEKKIGNMIVPGVKIERIQDIEKIIKTYNVEIAVLSVPVNAAQEVVDILLEAGIKGILNFTPTSLSVPENISVEDVDFVISLKSLTFEIASAENEL
ncbi:redox-sensing transcriptional repressor Rex [Oceanotoga sp. DSM 15011]|jgi:redox-sensing transcriptional repressor|uniref:Redox-sensing transcriptional repressor Rex n=1 Tax=Oceanotoga teriensis TaxID=515440 RepID=A0AA45C8C3_9BACT|nr:MULTISPECIES: redox-sensing transcriptional repressor Rex [Oceanotoga]MDN5342465.1 redox-sensing transcriptional repressor [Oceanotoga sp.]MDO7975582.1 redox-sensing transcriptional repressor Rex [Oceanotoga teriensis]PWJ96129.1 redox-sensing transcriptional repressor [Oceanotoga teriensis]UYO99912.1 redox-sensing transcriptional repressor Rex [Oceanotoga sp. DSM 15011]